jgi:hypothetical protein
MCLILAEVDTADTKLLKAQICGPFPKLIGECPVIGRCLIVQVMTPRLMMLILLL